MKESTQQPELRGGLAAKEKGLVTRERTVEITNLDVNCLGLGKRSLDCMLLNREKESEITSTRTLLA